MYFLILARPSSMKPSTAVTCVFYLDYIASALICCKNWQVFLKILDQHNAKPVCLSCIEEPLLHELHTVGTV